MSAASPSRSRGDPSLSWPRSMLSPTSSTPPEKRAPSKPLSRREAKTRHRRWDGERELERDGSNGPPAIVSSPAASMDFSHWGFPSREWESFVAHNPAAVIVPPIPSSIEELKRQANDVRVERGLLHIANEGLADKFTSRDYSIPTRDGQSIAMRAYRPAGVLETDSLPALVWFHGGGFLFGSLDGETYVCGQICHELQCAVLHICYRHTPEYTYPTAHHDAHDGFDFVYAHAAELAVDNARIVVGGISSGGQLAASVTYREVLAARRKGASSLKQQQQQPRTRIRGQVLSIPWLCHRDAYPYHLFRDRARASSRQCLWAPVTPKPRADLFTDLLRIQDVHGRLPNLALASEDELRGTVRTALVSAGMDVVRDEGLMYMLKLKSLGIQTKVHVFPGLPHAFYMFSELRSRIRYHEAVIECVKWAFADEPGQKEWYVEPPPREFAD